MHQKLTKEEKEIRKFVREAHKLAEVRNGGRASESFTLNQKLTKIE